LQVTLGEDRFGRYAIHANSVRPGLGGYVLGQDLDPGLGCGIRYWGLRVRPASRRRGDRDDAAGLSLLHTRQDALDRQKRRGEIPFDGGVPTLLAYLLDRSGLRKAAASIRHEDVDLSQRIFDLISHGFDLVEPRDIAEYRNSASAGTFYAGFDRGRRCRIPAVYGNLRPFACEKLGNGSPDAARTTGHKRNLVFQEIHTTLLRMALFPSRSPLSPQTDPFSP